MRAAPEDRLLSDAESGGIARDVMHRTGLCPRGEEDDAVRWIAIRHSPAHIHLVAMLARQDRTRPRIVNERYRVTRTHPLTRPAQQRAFLHLGDIGGGILVMGWTPATCSAS